MISFRLRIGILLTAAVEKFSVVLAQTPPKKTADEMNAAYDAHKAEFHAMPVRPAAIQYGFMITPFVP